MPPKPIPKGTPKHQRNRGTIGPVTSAINKRRSGAKAARTRKRNKS